MAFYPLLQIIDAAGNPLVDFHDLDGTVNTDGVETILDPDSFDLGMSLDSLGLIKPLGHFPASVVNRDLEPAEMSIRVLTRASSHTGYRSFMSYVTQLINAGGMMKWQASAVDEPLFIDYLGSNGMASPYHSQSTVRAIVSEGMDHGFVISVLRQAVLRGSELSSDTNKALNATLLRGTATPTGWAWDSTTNITGQDIASAPRDPLPNWGGTTYQFTIATTGTRNLQETTSTASFASGDVVTFSFYVFASAASVVRARAAVQFVQSNGTTVVGAENVGTLTAIGTGVTRVSVTTSAAGALTSRAKLSIRFENSTATSTVVYLAAAQAEVNSSASVFVRGTETVVNDPSASVGLAFPSYFHGTAPVRPTVRFKSLDSGAALTDLLVSQRSGDGQNVFLNTTKAFQCEDGTLGTGTASAADANASGGDVASLPLASAAVADRRVRITSTDTDGLRGTYEVYLRCKQPIAAETRIQLRWGASNVDPPEYSLPVVTLDTLQASETDFTDVPLGRVAFPLEGTLAEVTFELWAQAITGSGNLDFDYIYLVPVNPGPVWALIRGSSSSERWEHDEFIGGDTASFNPTGLDDGVDTDEGYALDATFEACGTPPVAGLAWPVGLHIVTFEMYNPPGATTSVFPRVSNITDSTLIGNLSHTYSTSGTKTETVAFASTAGKSYQPQVVVSSHAGLSPFLVRSITHSFRPALGLNDQIEFGDSMARVDEDGYYLGSVQTAGSLGSFEPGSSVLTVVPLDSALSGFAYPRSVFGREVEVSYTYSPCYYF